MREKMLEIFVTLFQKVFAGAVERGYVVSD
jgi:hypothetical protein